MITIGQIYSIFKDNQDITKIILTAFVITLIFSGLVESYLINTAIFIYLSYKTIKPLKLGEINLYPVLLKNWVFFALLISTEYILNIFFEIIFLSFLYNMAKIILAAMAIQQEDISIKIFDLIIKPVFDKYESQMDYIFLYLEQESQFHKKTTGNNYNIINIISPKNLK